MSDIRYVKTGTTTAAKLRVRFPLVVDATDFATPETGEAGGQPQVSVDSTTWTNTGIGVLNTVGFGDYYADLTSALVASGTPVIYTRYKSANTAEARGTTFHVVSWDPYTNEVQGNVTGNVTGSVASVTGNVGGSVASVGGNVGGNVVGSVGSVVGNIGGNITGNLLGTLPVDSIGASQIAANAIDDASVAADLDSYVVVVTFSRVDASNQRYGVAFWQNGGAHVTAAEITGTPTITVTNQAGTVKVNAQNLTAIAATGGWYYAASGASLLSAGDTALVQVTATIDGTARSLSFPVSYNNNA